MKKINNIYLNTSTKGSELNVLNLFMLAENIVSNNITLDNSYNLLSMNEEVKI